jgi:hypothetical protein
MKELHLKIISFNISKKQLKFFKEGKKKIIKNFSKEGEKLNQLFI